jgi:hypothetical protein
LKTHKEVVPVDYLNGFLKLLFPNPRYQVPEVVISIIIALLAIALLFKKFRSHRANLVLGMAISALFLTLMLVDFQNRWQWIVGLLPTLLVGYQAFFLWLYHPKEIGTRGKGIGISEQSASAYRTDRQRRLEEQSYLRAQQSMDSHFGLRTLFIRYGLPAAVLGIVGIIILDIAVDPSKFFSLRIVPGNQVVSAENVDKILLGIKLGAAGAYVYVLLELGRRTFLHDVTGASAMWCLVTLVLGPVLAATVAVLWRLGGPPNDGWWGGGVVLFFAGFAPRRVIAAIEQAALQLLKVGSQNAVVESHLIPLSKVRGITPLIEERLGEEGIVDVNSLAEAEPVRLVRNTSFDMRQILAWIDEAILIVTLPKSWEALEEEGITGALDLAWYYNQLFAADGSPLAVIPDPIKNLASKSKLSEAASLVSTIQRLYEDAQVQYIGALYYNFTEYSGGDGTGEDGGDRRTTASPIQLGTAN